jgi:hypothetical protein
MGTCFSDEYLEQLARESGFIKRKGRIGAGTFAKLLIFNELDQSQLSLLDLKLDLQSYFGCKITREAIHKRFSSEALSFLKALLAKLLEFRLAKVECSSSLAGCFNRLLLKDSSKFTIPSAFAGDYPGYGGFHKGNAIMNIQYEYDILTGNWASLNFTKATRNDQQDSKETLDEIKKNDLLVRDLCYVTMTYLNGVVKNEAYFLNRLPTSINIYSCKDQEYQLIDWAEVDKQFEKNALSQMELNVVLTSKHKIGARIVLAPVPKEVYSQRIKNASKHARSKGCQLSKEYKIKAKYNIFITNVPPERLSFKDIMQLYRLRWQIEIVFKSWKSNLSLHKTKKVKKERFECQLIARIIWALVSWRLFQAANWSFKPDKKARGISILKFSKQVIKFTAILREIIDDVIRFIYWIKEKFIPMIMHLLIETKKDKTSHCQILVDSFYKLS